MTFAAARATTLRAMTLELNLPRSLARYFQTPCARQVMFPEKVPPLPFTGRFEQNKQYLLAMNDRVGLQWLAESDQYWVRLRSKQALRSAPHGARRGEAN